MRPTTYLEGVIRFIVLFTRFAKTMEIVAGNENFLIAMKRLCVTHDMSSSRATALLDASSSLYKRVCPFVRLSVLS